MPYLFTCPHCGIQTQVDDEFSGQQGPCVNCGESVTIPNFTGRAEQATETLPEAGGRNTWKTVRTLVASTIALAVVVSLAIAIINRGATAVQQLQQNATRGQCLDNLQQIAAALNAYAADNGTYPPAVVRNEDGTVLHSWRVLILPYLGYDELFSQYNLDEPWDSETNMQLVYQMPAVFRSPASANIGSETSYALITGPGTLFPAGGPLGPDAIRDGAAKTLLVVETSANFGAVSWTEPGDLEISRMRMTIVTSDTTGRHEIGGHHPDGATVATCDGRSHFLPATTSPVTLRNLITPQGGEALPDDVLD